MYCAVFIRCTTAVTHFTHCHLLSLVATRCFSRYHSLSLDVPLVCLFINNRIISKTIHRFVTEVHKIIRFTHTKISTPSIFFDPPKTFWTHATHTTYAKVCLTPPTNPGIHTTHATHAIYQTRKINVNRKDNGLTTAELKLRYSP